MTKHGKFTFGAGPLPGAPAGGLPRGPAKALPGPATGLPGACLPPAPAGARTGALGPATGLPALPPAGGLPRGPKARRKGPAGACPIGPLPCLCANAGALCRAAATVQPMGAAATTSGYERFAVSVTMPGGITGTLTTSYLPGKHLGITMGVIGEKTIHCSRKDTK